MGEYVAPPLQRRYILKRGPLGFKNLVADADTMETVAEVTGVHLVAEPMAERIVAALNLQIGRLIEDPLDPLTGGA